MNDLKQYDSYRKRNDAFLTDEALERLIAEVEAEPLLHPPKEFKNDIMMQIQQKKKWKKNSQLFSYSLKVFAAAAAALAIVFIVPESIRPEENIRYVQDAPAQAETGQESGQKQTAETESVYLEGFGWAFSRRLDEYCSRMNRRLDQLVGMEVPVYEKEEK